MTQKKRPLSPHLQIYKPQLTSVLSIFHRLTGIALTGGTLGLVIWLFCLASGPQCFTTFQYILKNGFVKLMFLAITLSFFYHLLNGIRHLFWDVGHGYDLKTVYRSGWIVVILSFLLTAFSWISKL